MHPLECLLCANSSRLNQGAASLLEDATETTKTAREAAEQTAEARAAAERMADLMGGRAGETVGYLTRLDSKQSARTRILVVTEAILVNRLLDDPELAGVSAVLFDEAHERHLDGDLGLALALESRAVLREDLRVLVMSATIDGARFARLLGGDALIPTIPLAAPCYPDRAEYSAAKCEDITARWSDAYLQYVYNPPDMRRGLNSVRKTAKATRRP